MQYTYVASDNTATNGTALSVDNQDVTVYKIIFGTPADGKYAKIYNNVNPFSTATTNIAAYITQPTAAAGKNYTYEVDFGQGLRLGEGGNIVTDASQVTVIWDYTSV